MVLGWFKGRKRGAPAVRDIAKPEIPGLSMELDEASLEKLKKARIFIIGCGESGARAAVLLAATGVGNICLADNGFVEEKDIEKHPVFNYSHVGKRKSIVLADFLKEKFPVSATPSTARMRYDNFTNAARNCGIVIDCSNDLATHFLASDACWIMEKPVVIVLGYGVAALDPRNGACLRCIAGQEFNAEKADAGIAASEAIRLVLGKPASRVISAGNELHVEKNPDCLCAKAITLIDYEKWLGTKRAPESAASIFEKNDESKPSSGDPPDSRTEISPEDVKRKIESGEEIMLVDVREPWEHDIAKLEGSNLIPLGELSECLGKLPKGTLIVVFCHHGNRGAIAAGTMRAAGLKAANMEGGIDAWSRRVDSGVPLYD